VTASELYRFLCFCLSFEGEEEGKKFIIKKLASGEINQDAFIFLASNHFVLPALTLKFQKYGLCEFFSPDYATHLQDILALNQKRNQKILHQIEEINHALNKENIKPVYLKGTANLLDQIYTDVGERMIGDIDVLIQENDYLKAAEIVLSLGYQNSDEYQGDVHNVKHFPRLYKPDVPADIEIHRLPVDKKYATHFSSELIFTSKVQITNSVNAYVPADAHKLIHNFIHSQLSNEGYRFKRISLRDIYDVYLLSKRINPADIVNQIKDKNKAIAYFGFAERVFKDSYSPSLKDLPSAKKYIKKQQYYLNHSSVQRLHLRAVRLYQMVFVRYLFRIIRMPFSATSRKHVVNRLKDPGWYKKHFQGIRDSFS
jgi:hypothetical protein